MIGRGVRRVKIPVVRNSLRTVVNCRAVCSISDGEAIDKPMLYCWLVITFTSINAGVAHGTGRVAFACRLDVQFV